MKFRLRPISAMMTTKLADRSYYCSGILVLRALSARAPGLYVDALVGKTTNSLVGQLCGPISPTLSYIHPIAKLNSGKIDQPKYQHTCQPTPFRLCLPNYFGRTLHQQLLSLFLSFPVLAFAGVSWCLFDVRLVFIRCSLVFAWI